MQLKYIFIKKERSYTKPNRKNNKSKNAISNPIESMIKDLFKQKGNKKFEISVDDKNYEFNYECTKTINKSYYVLFNVNYTPAKNAKILNTIHTMITKGSHRKDFNIVLSYDSASQYYCEKIYPKFNEFERKIRNLIFNILIGAFGSKWFDKGVPKELQKELKEKKLNTTELIEGALHELTIYQLEKLLFETYREVKLSDLIDRDLNSEKLHKMEKEDIINILEKGRPNSLWDKLFKDSIKIVDFDKTLPRLREYRNKVAHSKYFDFNDYMESKKILNDLIKDLEAAIEITEVKEFDRIDLSGVFAALEILSEKAKDIGNQVNVDWNQLIETFSKIDFPKEKYDFSNIKNFNLPKYNKED